MASINMSQTHANTFIVMYLIVACYAPQSDSNYNV